MKVINGLVFWENPDMFLDNVALLHLDENVRDALERHGILQPNALEAKLARALLDTKDGKLICTVLENSVIEVAANLPLDNIIAAYRQAVALKYPRPSVTRQHTQYAVRVFYRDVFADDVMYIRLILPFRTTALRRLLKVDNLNTIAMNYLGSAVSRMGEVYYFSTNSDDLDINFSSNPLSARDRLMPTVKIFDAFMKALRAPVRLNKPAEQFEEQPSNHIAPVNAVNWDYVQRAVHYILQSVAAIHIVGKKATLAPIIEAKGRFTEPKASKAIVSVLNLSENIIIPEYAMHFVGKAAILMTIKSVIWPNEYSQFYLAFQSSPREALKYGTNSLHYLEHIFCNVIKDAGDYVSYNASTSSNGFMDFYFISSKEALFDNLKAFFKGLMSMFDVRAYEKYARLYHTEQRRVTSETSHMRYTYTGMFTENSDIYRGEFSNESVWHLLLYDCQFLRIVQTIHADLGDKRQAYVDEFDSLSKAFIAKWRDRYSLKTKEVRIPRIGIGLPSEMLSQHANVHDWKRIGFTFDDNPIINAIINATLGHYFNVVEYDDKRFIKAKQKKQKTITLRMVPANTPRDQFGYARLLTRTPNVTEKAFNDYIYKAPSELLSQYPAYKKKAAAIMTKLFDL